MRAAPNALAGLVLASVLAAAAISGCGVARPGAAPKATQALAARTSLKPREYTHLPVGATVPALPLTNLENQPDALENYRGLPVLLVFWATWCPTCTNEMPHLEALHNDLGYQGLKLLCVNASNEKIQKIRDFATWQGYTMPMFGQYTGAAMRDFLINNIPTLYFVKRDGVIMDVYSGEIDPADLRKRAKALLESK